MRRILMLVALLIAPAVMAQTYEQYMERGEGADIRGKTKKAAARYQAAIAVARTPEQRVEALLAYTDAVRGAMANKDVDAATAAAIEDAYRRAIAEATEKAAFKAHNDYGVFLLDRGNAEGSIAVFAAGEKNLGWVPASVASRYLSNSGLAHFRAGRYEEALQIYRRAVTSDPTFNVPVVAAYACIERLAPERAAGEAVRLVELLMTHDRLGLARTFIEKVMAHEPWHAQSPAMDQLLQVLVVWFIRTEATPADVAEEWLARIEHLAQELQGEAKEKADQLLLVYRGNGQPVSFETAVQQRFSQWKSENERRTLALLVRQAGDATAAADPKRAAEHYIAAWKLDPGNVEPMAYLADLLASWKDPEAEKLLDAMIAALFGDPEAEMAAVRIETADPAAELRLHMILGTIFEARGQWGPRSDVRSAVYHYAAARDAYERLRKNRSDAPAYPRIRSSLAMALEQTGDERGAWSEYVAAAEANLQGGDIETAELMLARSTQLGYQATLEEQAHKSLLAGRILQKKEASNAAWP